MTRLENALKLQAEAMLESAGLPDPLSTSQQNRPSSPNNSQVHMDMDKCVCIYRRALSTSQQNRPSSPNNSQVGDYNL